MFDIGFSELLLVGLVALLVLGPERLPIAARNAGLWLGRAKRAILSGLAYLRCRLTRYAEGCACRTRPIHSSAAAATTTGGSVSAATVLQP